LKQCRPFLHFDHAYDFDILVIGAGHAGAEAAMMAL
jgi:alkyl hydroperoxide reductase subunit AhpF